MSFPPSYQFITSETWTDERFVLKHRTAEYQVICSVVKGRARAAAPGRRTAGGDHEVPSDTSLETKKGASGPFVHDADICKRFVTEQLSRASTHLIPLGRFNLECCSSTVNACSCDSGHSITDYSSDTRTSDIGYV